MHAPDNPFHLNLPKFDGEKTTDTEKCARPRPEQKPRLKTESDTNEDFGGSGTQLDTTPRTAQSATQILFLSLLKTGDIFEKKM